MRGEDCVSSSGERGALPRLWCLIFRSGLHLSESLDLSIKVWLGLSLYVGHGLWFCSIMRQR